MRTRWSFAVVLIALALAPLGSGSARRATITLASVAPARSISRPQRSPGPDAPRPRPSGHDTVSETAYVTHAVYFVPSDRPDEGLDIDGTIASSMGSMNGWFNAQMGTQPRIDRTATGAYDVTFVSGDSPAASYTRLSSITTELAAKGFNSAAKRYLVFAAVNGGNTCGEGDFPLQPGTTGHYAAIYLDSSAACGARNFGDGSAAGSGKAETIIAHEWLHTEGVEPLLAPHSCPTSIYHVCTAALWEVAGLDPEEPDIVFPVINAPLSQKVLDRGRDDYLDAPWPWITNLRQSPWFE